MEYRSWISTLSGHLFFHLSEPWNYRLDRIVADVIHFNEKIGDERYICISLLADLRDYNTKKKVKYTRIFFFGTTHLENGNDGKNLKGTISFFSNGKNRIFEKDEQGLVGSLDSLRLKLKNLTKKQIEEEKLILISEFKDLETTVLQYKKEAESVYTRKIQFCLQSEGIIDLGNAENAQLTHVSTKTEFRQAYHFIKFMFHNHMHHVKSAEDIIRLTSINDNTTDEQFAFLMISDIKKYMVEKRYSRKDFQELEGFSAYAKSLLQILEKKSFINKDTVERESKYFNNFVQSANSHVSRINLNTKNTKLGTLIDWFLKIFVVLMSLIAPYAIIKSKDITSNKSLTINDFLIDDIFPLYVKGFFLLVLIVPILDFIYNSKRSFIHLKWNRLMLFFGRFIKERHNPTLKNKSINNIISFRQFLYHVKFSNKAWYFYLKVLISFIILVTYITLKFIP
ncbi:MAG: hypothetical protein KAI79_20530 [Bacteroidales bacterium]|nr:hypothetical protein [Bacteroidales bacterium]